MWFRAPGGQWGNGAAARPWYRSQGILGVAGWLVLTVGSLALLWAAGAASAAREAGLLAFLAFLPTASSAVVQLYHPQDVVSLGIALGAMASVLRRKWIAAGALGLAVLTKQYALLLLLPTLATAPGVGQRLRIAAAAAVVFAAGIAPFFLSAPHATLANFSGFSAGGAVSGFTVLSLSGVTGSAASAIAGDAPVIFALGVCIWTVRRGEWANRPVILVALGLSCVGGRLVSNPTSPITSWRAASSSSCSTSRPSGPRSARSSGAQQQRSSSPSARATAPSTPWGRSYWRCSPSPPGWPT